jgi:hypothetical protein
MSHVGKSRNEELKFDQDDFGRSREKVLLSALSLELYRGCQQNDLFMCPRRVLGDRFAETGDELSTIVIVCKESLTNEFGVHDKGGGYKINAFGQKKLAQTAYNYAMIARSLGASRSSCSFDNVLLKPMPTLKSKQVSMDSGTPGLAAAKQVVWHNLRSGGEFFFGMGGTAGPGCINSLKAIAAETPSAECVTIDMDIDGAMGKVKISLLVLSFGDGESRPCYAVKSERHLSKAGSKNESKALVAAVIPLALMLTGEEVDSQLCLQLANCLEGLPASSPPFDSDTGAAAGECSPLSPLMFSPNFDHN